jgi:hypothetical protein
VTNGLFKYINKKEKKRNTVLSLQLLDKDMILPLWRTFPFVICTAELIMFGTDGMTLISSIFLRLTSNNKIN